MKTSIFEIFKIGIGPSSSHTVGPMRAARDFVSRLADSGRLSDASRLGTELYGSLALTGRGHATDRAILLGLLGESPDEVEPNKIDGLVTDVRTSGVLKLLHRHPIKFDEPNDLVFRTTETLSAHSNGMRFTAYSGDGSVIDTQIYYSIGGGFIVKEGDRPADAGVSRHNLGMTCDPIGGLVQIPCIERNAMGSVKAINAARMSMSETGEHKVSLDQVIETMYRTGQDMQTRYKETSLGGLALNIIEC